MMEEEKDRLSPWAEDRALPAGPGVPQEVALYARDALDTARSALLVVDADLCVQWVNRAFCTMFHVNLDETLGRRIYELGNREWDIPDLRALLENILPDRTEFNDFEVTHCFEHIGERVMLLNARAIYRASGPPQLILLAIEDVTERRKAQRALREARDELERRVKHRTSELEKSNEALQRGIEEREQILSRLERTLAELARTNEELKSFVYMVSHDLREPLVVSQMLARRACVRAGRLAGFRS